MVDLPNAKWVALNEFLVALGCEHRFDRLSDRLLEGARRLVPFDGAAVLLDLRSGDAEIRKSVGLDERWIPLFCRYRDSLDEKPPFQEAVMATTFENAAGADRCAYYRKFIAPLRVRAAAGLTLRDENGVPAFSFIFNNSDAPFSEGDLAVLAVVRAHAENYYRLARRVERLAGSANIEPDYLCGLLSRREREIADLLSRGLRPVELARALGISVGTVRKHIEHIYDKLNVSSRRELLACVRAACA